MRPDTANQTQAGNLNGYPAGYQAIYKSDTGYEVLDISGRTDTDFDFQPDTRHIEGHVYWPSMVMILPLFESESHLVKKLKKKK